MRRASRSGIRRRTRPCSGALERSVRQTSNRQLIRVKRHINDPEFASAIVTALRALVGRPGTRRKVAR